MDRILDLNKFDRINLLSGFGLNVPFMTKAKMGGLHELKESYSEFITQRPSDKISIRTFVDDNINVFHCPFYPFNQPEKAWELAKSLYKKYHIIFTEGVDPLLNIFCGSVTFFPTRDSVPNIFGLQEFDQPIALFEFITGTGTVRDMRTRPLAVLPVLLHGHVVSTFHKYVDQFPSEIKLSISQDENFFINTLQKILRKLYKFPYAYNYTIEFGVSCKRIGQLKDHIIFWEVR